MNKKFIFILAGSIGISFCSGLVIGRLTKKPKVKDIPSFGNLRIDLSEPDEEPKIFLELECSQEELFSSNEIKLNIVQKNYVSQ